jgi:Ni/Co efflux regulator RcnB
MFRIQKFIAIPLLGAALLGSQALLAQDHRDNSHYVRHDEWRKGYHMPAADWGRGDRISNWNQYRLSRPPRGYEWRRVDGNFVLAAVATGVVASVVVAAAVR